MTANSLVGINLVLAGHGSRDADGVAEFERFAQLFKEHCLQANVEHGYLEFQKPTIADAVQRAVDRSGAPTVIVPALLAAATHAKNDMPSLLRYLKNRHATSDLRFAAVMDLHPVLLQLCEKRIIEAEAKSDNIVRRSQSCLVVAGRGTSDPDANGDIAKLTRMLHEGMSFGASLVCYSGTAAPLVQDGLKQASRLGYKRIVVLPYFLFDGVLVKRIYAAADDLQRRMPEIEVIKADYLGVNPSVAAVLAERAYEAIHGTPAMNCGMCKYRIPIVGYEAEVGLPARPHAEVQVLQPYQPHPIEAESFRIIDSMFDWAKVPADHQPVLKRLVHTTGYCDWIDDMFFSPGAVATGVRALLRCKRVVTDVTMVQTGLKRSLLNQLSIQTWCGVHDEQTAILAKEQNITRSAAGIRCAWEKFGNDMVLAIGDAPTAVMETVDLIVNHGFRPQLVVALPVGFVGTAECKSALRACMQVPRITNSGTRGGSPWAAATINAMLIEAVNSISAVERRLPACISVERSCADEF